MKIMKTMLWTLATAAVTLSVLGCYSVGAWAGHDEQIIPWEPTLAVEAPAAPKAPAEAAKAIAPAPKADVPPPDILIAAAKTTGSPTAAESAPWQTPTEEPSPVMPDPALAPEPEATTAPELEPAVVPAPAAAVKTAPAEAAAPAVTADKMIEDAAKLDSNSTRRSVYVAVAKRFDLGPNAQVRLVNDAYDNLLSETAIEEVFLTLIQNPNFAPAAQHAILKRADNFLNETARQRITAALIPK